MSRFLPILLVALMLSACATDAPAYTDEELEVALTEISATRTSQVRLSPTVAELSATSLSTPSPEMILTQSPEPEAPHEDGIYIVGAEIAPGLWRSTSEDQRFCYWARRKYDGILLSSYYGLPGIELRIFSSDYEVELDGCGTWIHMGNK